MFCQPDTTRVAEWPKKRPSTKLGRSPTGRYEDDERFSITAFESSFSDHFVNDQEISE